MTFIKRLRATFVGNLDAVIGQIENQDAVVDAIVKDARQALAAAKVRLARVDQDAQRMQLELQQLDAAIAKWTERAARVGASDAEKAVACLSERKKATLQQQDLLARFSEHQQIHQRLKAEVKKAETRLSDILNKQHLMRTRESAANATRGISAIDTQFSDDLAATFERWEIKVTESELQVGTALHAAAETSLEQLCLAEEEDAELRRELAELMAQQTTSQG